MYALYFNSYYLNRNFMKEGVFVERFHVRNRKAFICRKVCMRQEAWRTWRDGTSYTSTYICFKLKYVTITRITRARCGFRRSLNAAAQHRFGRPRSYNTKWTDRFCSILPPRYFRTACITCTRLQPRGVSKTSVLPCYLSWT